MSLLGFGNILGYDFEQWAKVRAAFSNRHWMVLPEQFQAGRVWEQRWLQWNESILATSPNCCDGNFPMKSCDGTCAVCQSFVSKNGFPID